MSSPPADGPTLSDGDVYGRLSAVLHRETDFRTKSTELLGLGTEYLGVENGHITRIDPQAGFWEAIGSSNPADGPVPVGRRFDLAETYCRKSFEDGETVAVHHAAEQGWVDDPAYRAHEFETYLGTAYRIDGREFGTVCFVSPGARSPPFTEAEVAFVEFLAGFVGRLLEQRRQEALIEDRERVISTLSRVLRHNLSNDLNVIHGHAEMVAATADETAEHHVETIKSNAEDLIHLATKARKLQAVVSADATRSPLDLDALVHSCADTVTDSFPDATVSIDCPEALTVHVLPYLETAVVELLENAAKHAADDPHVEVTVTRNSRTFAVRIADDGDGLPEMEQQVLEAGAESPLVHGSGLGLWLVHWVVERHDGEIDVTRTASGTTVDVAIPYATAKLPVDVEASDPSS